MFRLMTDVAIFTTVTVLSIGVLKTNPAQAETLWYNGDLNSISGEYSVNQIGSQPDPFFGNFPIYQIIYDDFVVQSSENWIVNTIWSNNGMDFTATEATWSILTGVSSGNPGTIIASGTNSVTQTPTRNMFYGNPEYTVAVSGLNISLSPGRYWLSVTPIGIGDSRLPATSGLNAVGIPAGNNDNSFAYNPNTGVNFLPNNLDYSMGVGGEIKKTSVPEPSSTLGILISAFGGGLLHLRHRRLALFCYSGKSIIRKNR
jgi:hypothetical protein